MKLAIRSRLFPRRIAAFLALFLSLLLGVPAPLIESAKAECESCEGEDGAETTGKLAGATSSHETRDAAARAHRHERRGAPLDPTLHGCAALARRSSQHPSGAPSRPGDQARRNGIGAPLLR